MNQIFSGMQKSRRKWRFSIRRLSNAPLLIKACVSIFTDDSGHKTKRSSSITPSPSRAAVYFSSPSILYFTKSTSSTVYSDVLVGVHMHPQGSPMRCVCVCVQCERLIRQTKEYFGRQTSGSSAIRCFNSTDWG